MENEIIQFLRQKDYLFVKNIGQGGCAKTLLLKDEFINEYFVYKIISVATNLPHRIDAKQKYKEIIYKSSSLNNLEQETGQRATYTRTNNAECEKSARLEVLVFNF